MLSAYDILSKHNKNILYQFQIEEKQLYEDQTKPVVKDKYNNDMLEQWCLYTYQYFEDCLKYQRVSHYIVLMPASTLL